MLCDFAHGALTQNILKWKVSEGKIYTDKGLVFKERETNFNVNFFAVCLYGNLKFLKKIFPEIFKNSEQDYMQIYHGTIEFWDFWLIEAMEMDDNSWYKIMKPITDV